MTSHHRYIVYGVLFIFSTVLYMITFQLNIASLRHPSLMRSSHSIVSSKSSEQYRATTDPSLDGEAPTDAAMTRFEFLKRDIEKLRGRLAEKDAVIKALRVNKATDSLNAVELFEPSTAVVSDSPIFFTIVTFNDMPRLRDLVGSIHSIIADPSSIPRLNVYGYAISQKYIDEIAYWSNVEYVDLNRHLTANLGSKQIKNNFDLVMRVLANSICMFHSSCVFISNSLVFRQSNALLRIRNQLQHRGGIFTRNETHCHLFGFRKGSKAFQMNVRDYLDCRMHLTTTSPENEDFRCGDIVPAENFVESTEYFLGAADTSTAKAEKFFCSIAVRPDSIMIPVLERETLPFTLGIGKPIIGIGLPTTGHSLQSWEDSLLLRTFLPNFLASITEDDCRLFEFILYIGYDAGDSTWDSDKLRQLLKSAIYKQIQSHKCVHVDYVRIPYSNAWLTMIWSRLYTKCIHDGCNYYFQVNDDLKFVDAGWAMNYTMTLDLNDGYGVVGPFDPKWNCTLLTQAMVTRRHYERYQTFYPLEIKDWYSDYWITRIYQPSQSTFCFPEFSAVNTREQGTRYQLCNRPKWTQAISRDIFIKPAS
eukprot:Partr_v1_DN26908_c0_g1_i1_m6916 putative NA